MKYILIVKYLAEDFSLQVNSYLDKGWTIYGNPFSRGEYYCQAMTYYSNPAIPVTDTGGINGI